MTTPGHIVVVQVRDGRPGKNGLSRTLELDFSVRFTTWYGPQQTIIMRPAHHPPLLVFWVCSLVKLIGMKSVLFKGTIARYFVIVVFSWIYFKWDLDIL
jgi:hypothetical protein